ncbi:MAG: beta-lactamase family protein [Verrucomicrobiales bacterium]|nr:beta-lactamase family protein [Verrucomicrobiales bacterium]
MVLIRTHGVLYRNYSLGSQIKRIRIIDEQSCDAANFCAPSFQCCYVTLSLSFPPPPQIGLGEQAGDLKPDHGVSRLTFLIRIPNIFSESRPLIRLRFLKRSAKRKHTQKPDDVPYMKAKHRVSILLSTCFACLFLLNPDSTSAEEVFPQRSWALAPPKFLDSRWDPEKLRDVQKRWEALRENKKSSALVIVDSGYLVLSLGDSKRPIQCHSIRKSFLHSLYGRLAATDCLDMSQTLADLGTAEIAELTVTEGEATLRNVLQCRSGVYLPAQAETCKMKKERPKRGSHAPGTFFYYNNWDFNAAGGIFTRLDGRKIFNAFQEDIASPLGMEDIQEDHHALENKDGQYLFPSYMFRMSARDRARFGLLYLREGNWNGREVVPREFIWETLKPVSTVRTDPDSAMLSSGKSYSTLWWIGEGGWLWGENVGGMPISARGVAGNFIGVIPSKDLVVVHANDKADGDNIDPGGEWNDLFSLICGAHKEG